VDVTEDAAAGQSHAQGMEDGPGLGGRHDEATALVGFGGCRDCIGLLPVLAVDVLEKIACGYHFKSPLNRFKTRLSKGVEPVQNAPLEGSSQAEIEPIQKLCYIKDMNTEATADAVFGEDARVKLKDVAKAAGVSQGTASNVFSKPEIVREEVREHVLEVAKRLGYAGPSVTGRLLRAGKVNAVGVAAIEPLS
jgi:hypothetical protein